MLVTLTLYLKRYLRYNNFIKNNLLKPIKIVLKTIFKNKLTVASVFDALIFMNLHTFYQLKIAIWTIKINFL
jgi:hypothetical protein